MNVNWNILTRLSLCGLIVIASACEKKSSSGGSAGIKGDFNSDGKIDKADFALVASLGKFNQPATVGEGDINGDGIFDISDVSIMLAGVDDSAPVVGDANRDGTVDILDAAQVIASGKFASGEAATWEQGDFDGDTKVTSDDMSLLQASVRQASNPAVGDCTGDGKADGADLGKFMIRYNVVSSNATWLDCDFNGDGMVDQLDASAITTQEVSINGAPSVPLVFANVMYGTQPNIADLSNPPPREGDINGDGKVDDLDALQVTGGGKYDKGAAGAVRSDGDANEDGMVDILDVAVIIANMDATTRRPGDANGDGLLNATDVAQILAAKKYETGEAATWAQGDFNGDGLFDMLDWSLVLASGAKFE